MHEVKTKKHSNQLPANIRFADSSHKFITDVEKFKYKIV